MIRRLCLSVDIQEEMGDEDPEDVVSELYYEICDLIEARGYKALEVSNRSRGEIFLYSYIINDQGEQEPA